MIEWEGTLNNTKLLLDERILQFKLSRESSLIDDGYKGLIMCILYGKNITSIDDINYLVMEILNIKPIPTYILQKHLYDLIQNNFVIFKDGEYKLSIDKRKELEATFEKRIRIKELINKEVIEAVKSYYKGKIKIKIDEDKIIDVINEVLSIFFTRGARLFSAYLLEEKKLVFEIPILENIIGEILDEFEDSQFRSVLKEVIVDKILKGSNIMYEYLFDIFEIYVYFEILNINPETQIKLKIEEVYLDTNILLDLLLPSRRHHDLSLQIIEMSHELEIENKYTIKTYNELFSVIEDYKKATTLSEKALEKWSKNDAGGIIEAYFIEKKINPSLTYEGFCLGLQKGFKETLLRKFNIKFDDKEYNEIDIQSKELEPLVNKYSNEITREYKSKESISHDAFCLQLQKIKPLSWFITRDKSLFYISKFLLEKLEISKSLSVDAEVWLQALTFIRPPLNKRTSIEAFKEFISTPLTATLRPIHMNKLIAVAFPWIKTDFFKPEDYEDVISSKFIEDHIIKPQEKAIPILTFEEIVPKIIDEKVKQKIIDLEKDKETAIKEKEDIEKRIGELVTEKFEIYKKEYDIIKAKEIIKIKPFFYIGVILMIILIFLIYFSGIQQINISNTAYYCLTIIILILLGSSVFGESIFNLIKKSE